VHEPRGFGPLRKPLKNATSVPGHPSAMSRDSHMCAPEGIRTPNLLIRRHRPITRPGAYEVYCRVVKVSGSPTVGIVVVSAMRNGGTRTASSYPAIVR